MSKRSHKIRHQYSDILPVLDSPSFNQTIIINSPRFNINLINDRRKPNTQQTGAKKQQRANRTLTTMNATAMKQTLSGIDSWMFNENLKQFGQTRQRMFPHARETDTNSPYVTQTVRKAQSGFHHQTIHKRSGFNNTQKPNPYNPESEVSNQLSRTAKQSKTIDVRRRRFVRQDVTVDKSTPEYPNKTRGFRANKFTAVSTTPMNQQHKEDIHSSQQVINDVEKSISDIDKSIHHVMEKYFTHQQHTKSRHDIQSYVSIAKQPSIRPKQIEFVSKIKPEINDGGLDFDFQFQEETENKQQRTRTPSRHFKINKSTRPPRMFADRS